MLSGTTEERPELQSALALAKKHKASLLVAKLDRLSRKVSFIAALVDDPKVNLRVASMPYADKFQIHIYAALAEQERDFISKRTKAALKEAKERGVVLGGDRGSLRERNAARKNRADALAAKVRPVVEPMKDAGSSLQSIAEALESAGIPKSRGGTNWTPTDIRRVIARF